jgi:hypothetical protein
MATEQTKEARARQQWSQYRNTLRFRLGGTVRNLEEALESKWVGALAQAERKELEAAVARLRRTLSRWPKRNEESKKAWMSAPSTS